MGVQVNQARRYDLASDVLHLAPCKTLPDCSHPAAGKGHIGQTIQPAGRIDYPSAP
jgi:hypothetical protein